MTQAPPSRHWLFFLLTAILWAALLVGFSLALPDRNFWFLVLAVLVLSLPILLSALYASTVRQSLRLHQFARHGLLFRLLSGRLLRYVFWLLWSPVLALFLLLQFHGWSMTQWLFFFLVIPVFWLTHSLMLRLLSPELRPWLLTSYSLIWASRVTPLLMLALTLVVQVLAPELLGTTANVGSVSESIEQQRALLADLDSNHLLLELAGPLAIYRGFQGYVASLAGTADFWLALLISATGSYLVYFSACSMLSAMLIPATEYRRLINPPSDKENPAPVQASALSVSTALGLFIILFIYVPTMGSLEEWAQQARLARLSSSVQTEILRLDRIGSNYYRQGTLAELEQARLQALQQVQGALESLQDDIDTAFDQLTGNVDTYLDWYYSLGGEYGRLGSLMLGELESYMQEKLTEHLQQGDHFRSVQQAMEQTLQTHEEARQAYQRNALAIMAMNQQTVSPDQEISVLNEVSLEAVMNPPVPQELLRLEQRALASGGGGAAAGVMTAVMVQKIAVKAAGKNVFKLAASAIGKLALGKTAGSLAGAGAGAAGGAALGSVIPGPGTALGAIIGGIAGGILAGIGIDKTLIEIEEYVNRDAFRLEILAAIEEARQEFKASISG